MLHLDSPFSNRVNYRFIQYKPVIILDLIPTDSVKIKIITGLYRVTFRLIQGLTV